MKLFSSMMVSLALSASAMAGVPIQKHARVVAPQHPLITQTAKVAQHQPMADAQWRAAWNNQSSYTPSMSSAIAMA